MASPQFRKSQRISVTVPDHIHHALIERSLREGRSLSNLASFLLEVALTDSLAEPERAALAPAVRPRPPIAKA